MAVSCFFLLLLALSPSLSMAELPNEAMMNESSRFLSDRFQQLRKNGLGVEHMKVCYIIIVINIIYLPFSLHVYSSTGHVHVLGYCGIKIVINSLCCGQTPLVQHDGE